jgi:lipid-A-disaccharide synthase
MLAQHGIDATYVGHPLAQVIPRQVDRLAARAQLGLRQEDDVLALLPGSRRSEIQYLAPVFFQAAARIAKARPHVKFLLPAVPGLEALINRAAQDNAMAGKVQMVSGQSHTVLAACDATLIASGTATLEAALFKRPMVIAYRMGALSWHWMRRKRLQPWVGLPNILSGEFVVPEFLQDRATPQALAEASLQWLDGKASNPDVLRGLEMRFDALHESLRRDTGALAAQAIDNMLHA